MSSCILPQHASLCLCAASCLQAYQCMCAVRECRALASEKQARLNGKQGGPSSSKVAQQRGVDQGAREGSVAAGAAAASGDGIGLAAGPKPYLVLPPAEPPQQQQQQVAEKQGHHPQSTAVPPAEAGVAAAVAAAMAATAAAKAASGAAGQPGEAGQGTLIDEAADEEGGAELGQPAAQGGHDTATPAAKAGTGRWARAAMPGAMCARCIACYAGWRTHARAWGNRKHMFCFYSCLVGGVDCKSHPRAPNDIWGLLMCLACRGRFGASALARALLLVRTQIWPLVCESKHGLGLTCMHGTRMGSGRTHGWSAGQDGG